MKILVVGDVHWCAYSSTIRGRGDRYSTRLENLIRSVNWVEDRAVENHCDKIIYLGDFFDRSDLNNEEITALSEIKWADIPHLIIVGNHEITQSRPEYSSAHTLKLLPNFTVISEPSIEAFQDVCIAYLPYMSKDNMIHIKDIWEGDEPSRIVFSHNDIKGINYGNVISKEGMDVEDIKEGCDLFINGHLHNGTSIAGMNKAFCLGNLTGQNFGEDALTYSHRIAILDTSDIKNIKFEVNPYAFNFIKAEGNFDTIRALERKITSLDLQHVVLSLKVPEEIFSEIREEVEKIKEVEMVRITVIPTPVNSDSMVSSNSLNGFDHLNKFHNYIVEQLGSSETVLQELAALEG